MQAAVVTELGGPLQLQRLPLPPTGRHEVLVRVHACGVCHTDLHAARGDWPVKPTTPFVPGHEVAGVVVALGSQVENVAVGDRVGIAWLHDACGRCAHCCSGRETLCAKQHNTGYSVHGGFAEFAIGHADYVVKLPEVLSFTAAAPILCAGVTSYKALEVSEARPGDWVAISGVGGLGHLAIQYAVAMGLDVAAIDVSGEKLELARRLGARVVVNAREEDPAAALRKKIGGAHASLVTAVSGAAFTTGIGSLRAGGTCVLVGLPPGDFATPIFDVVLEGLTVRGSIAGTRVDLEKALAFAAEGKVAALTTACRLAHVNDVLDGLRQGTLAGRAVVELPT